MPFARPPARPAPIAALQAAKLFPRNPVAPWAAALAYGIGGAYFRMLERAHRGLPTTTEHYDAIRARARVVLAYVAAYTTIRRARGYNDLDVVLDRYSPRSRPPTPCDSSREVTCLISSAVRALSVRAVLQLGLQARRRAGARRPVRGRPQAIAAVHWPRKGAPSLQGPVGACLAGGELYLG